MIDYNQSSPNNALSAQNTTPMTERLLKAVKLTARLGDGEGLGAVMLDI